MTLWSRFLLSPVPWMAIMILFTLQLQMGLIPLESLAITQTTLPTPKQWHTLFTAGLTHKTWSHLSVNLLLMIGLAYLFFDKVPTKPLKSFVKRVLILNVLHGLALALLLQGITSTTYVYGSSGIVCGLGTFLKRCFSKDTSTKFRFLSAGIAGLLGFCFLDISFSTKNSLTSLSHLLGLILGFFLSYTHGILSEDNV